MDYEPVAIAKALKIQSVALFKEDDQPVADERRSHRLHTSRQLGATVRASRQGPNRLGRSGAQDTQGTPQSGLVSEKRMKLKVGDRIRIVVNDDVVAFATIFG
jgi:hypothetical protein